MACSKRAVASAGSAGRTVSGRPPVMVTGDAWAEGSDVAGTRPVYVVVSAGRLARKRRPAVRTGPNRSVLSGPTAAQVKWSRW